MTFRAYWIVISTLVLTAIPGYAGDPGSTAGNVLKLGIGPRSVGMGEAQVALADDVYATYWNPAGLAQLDGREAGFVHNQYVQGIQEEFAAYAHPVERVGTFAGSFSYLRVEKFQGYDAGGQPTSQVGASDSVGTFSYARALQSDVRLESLLAVGVSGKWLHETLDTVSANALALDAGALYRPGRQWFEFLRGWGAGVTVKNIGTSMKYDQESFTVPRALTVGLSYQGEFLGEKINFALDAQQPNDGQRTVGVGAEVWTLKTVVLRAGYTSHGDLGNGLRVGGGIRFKTLQVDYAFAGAGDVGNAHRIGATFRFEPSRPNAEVQGQDWYRKGLREYKNARYPEALVDFNKALELDPTHPEALEMMRKTNEKLKETNP